MYKGWASAPPPNRAQTWYARPHRPSWHRPRGGRSSHVVWPSDRPNKNVRTAHGILVPYAYPKNREFSTKDHGCKGLFLISVRYFDKDGSALGTEGTRAWPLKEKCPSTQRACRRVHSPILPRVARARLRPPPPPSGAGGTTTSRPRREPDRRACSGPRRRRCVRRTSGRIAADRASPRWSAAPCTAA